jgi:hypothetical protein
MAIHLLTGLPASGKTAALTAKALDLLDTNEVDVYANYHIETDSKRFHYWHSLSQLVRIKHGTIILDEAQIYFNSRAWSKLPLKLQYKLQQHRKQGIHIWASVQHINRIDVVMRELITNYYECRKVFIVPFSKRGLTLYKITEYQPIEATKLKRDKLERRWYWGLSRLGEYQATLPSDLMRAFNRYDTMKEIQTPHDSEIRYERL